MTVNISPPPQDHPKDGGAFFARLVKSVYSLFAAVGGQDGVPKIFRQAGTPAGDPGWSTSSSADMTPPDGYLKVLNEDGDEIAIPYWDI